MQFPDVTDFAKALDDAVYRPVPDDWQIALSDVIGSTAAIEAGRYKDVNLAGAATIAAIQNACPDTELPFAFGGDGAAVLVPPDLKELARAALAGIHRISRDVLGLQIRCALVPVAEIRQRGRDVGVVRHRLAGGRHLAMMAGGGIEAAEALSRTAEGDAFAVRAIDSDAQADLTGLSCRWQPLVARHGVIMSLIIRVRGSDHRISPLYRDLHARIEACLSGAGCPVSLANLRSSLPPRGAALERAFGHSRFGVYGQAALAKLSELTGLTIGGFDGRAYRKSLPAHSDYRKFSDSLRMVVDCTERESKEIESILEAGFARNELWFGIHRAPAALMTCFVDTTEDGKHVHFIDGADGGYALAAQQLKMQIASGA